MKKLKAQRFPLPRTVNKPCGTPWMPPVRQDPLIRSDTSPVGCAFWSRPFHFEGIWILLLPYIMSDGSVICISGYPSSPLLVRGPQQSQRFVLVARQYNDITELHLVARQAAAVLVGPGVAGGPSQRRGRSGGVLRSSALAYTSAVGGGTRG